MLPPQPTNTPHTPLRVGVCYGFLGGPAHGQRFLRAARAAGFGIAPLAKADIIIAHSAGCWLLPPTVRPKLIVYIGMPLTMARAQKAWLSANLRGLRYGNIRQNLRTRVLNAYYILRQPRRNLDILRHPKIAQPTLIATAPAVFIANRYDPWPVTDDWPQFIQSHDWCYINMPGAHDNVWEEPAEYIAIIKSYANGLLAQAGE